MATFRVTTLVDEDNGPSSGAGLSLREAVKLANTTAGPDRIEFSAAVRGEDSLDDDERGVGVVDLPDRIYTNIVHIEAGESFADAMAGQPAGTLYIVGKGEHREQQVIPRHGDAFIGEPDAAMTGARALPASGWHESGESKYLAIDPSKALKLADVIYNGVCGDQRNPNIVNGNPASICGYPEQLYRTEHAGDDPVVVKRVADKDSLKDGECWFLDYHNQKIFVHGIDPSKVASLELGTSKFAFGYDASQFAGAYGRDRSLEQPLPDSPADMPNIYDPNDPYYDKPRDVVIQNLTIEKYANPAQTGAIGYFRPGLDWVVENNEVRWNNGTGIQFRGDHAVVRDNIVEYNGCFGMAAGDGNRTQYTDYRNSNLEEWGDYGGYAGNGGLVQNNEIAHNRLEVIGIDSSWGAGGTKFMQTFNLQVLNNDVHDNDGRGLWSDTAYAGTLYQGNDVYSNGGEGILVEGSLGPTRVIDNTTFGNGKGDGIEGFHGAQISIASSSLAEVTGNDVTTHPDRGNGIVVTNGDMNGREAPRHTEGIAVQGFGSYIHDNTILIDGSLENGTEISKGSRWTGGQSTISNKDFFYFPSANRFENNTYYAESSDTKVTGHGFWRWPLPYYDVQQYPAFLDFAEWQARGQDPENPIGLVRFGSAASEELTGSAGDDSLYLGAGSDVGKGAAGRDFIAGEAGNDLIHGGADRDVLSGGAGNDVLDGGGAAFSGIASIAVEGDPRVYYQGDDLQIHELAWYSGAWHHRLLTEETTAPVTTGSTVATGSKVAAITSDGDPRVYYLGPDYRVQELAWYADAWHHRIVTTDADARAAAGSALAAITDDGDPRVYYQGQDRNVHELAWYSGDWHHRIVTTDAGGPVAAIGSALTAISFEGDPRVYYLGEQYPGAGQQVHELAWDGDEWQHRTVTIDAGGPPAGAESALSAITYNGDPRVYYQGPYNNLHELAWENGAWHHRVVTTEAGGPLANAGSGLAAITYDGDPRVYYQGQDHQAHELAWYDGRWHHREVAAEAGGPLAVDGGTFAATSIGDGDPRVYYQAADNHVQELGWASDDQWSHRGITADAAGPASWAGGDYLLGDNGNDTLAGGPGPDVLDGGLGFDTADYSASPEAVTLLLSHTDADGVGGIESTKNKPASWTGGDAQGDSFVGIEGVIGSKHNDLVYGFDAVQGYLDSGRTGLLVESRMGTWADLGDGDDIFDNDDRPAFVDTTPGNAGGAYRADDVDIESGEYSGGGYHVSKIETGEYLTYGFYVPAHITDDWTEDYTIAGYAAPDQKDEAGKEVSGFTVSLYGPDDSSPLATQPMNEKHQVYLVEGAQYQMILTATAPLSTLDYITLTLENQSEIRIQAEDYRPDAVDTIFGGAGNDKIWTGAGNDELYGGPDNDFLSGEGGNDTLRGDAGEDSLIGGAGADILSGGADRDQFIIEASAHSRSSLRDHIQDFELGVDRINLSAIDANFLAPGNQAFAFIGTRPFSALLLPATPGQVRVSDRGSETLVQWNTDFDRDAEGEVLVNDGALTAAAWSAAAFVL